MVEGSPRSLPAGGGSRLVLDNPNVADVSAEAAAGAGSDSSDCQHKRKWKQVIPHDIIELDADPDGVMITGEKTSDHVNKLASGFHKDWSKHAKSDVEVADNFAGPSAIPATNVDPWHGLGGFHLNVGGPNPYTTTNIYPWNGLGGFLQNAGGPNPYTTTNIYPWNVLGGIPQNAGGPNPITATNIYPWNGLGGFSQNAAGPSAIPATKFYPWYGLGGFPLTAGGPDPNTATHIYPWNGLGGFSQNAGGPDPNTATHIYPWNVLGGFPQNAGGSNPNTATHIYPWNGLGGFLQNATGPSAIPATKFYPWYGMGGFPHNVASPNAIPAANFYPWDGQGAYHGATVLPTLHIGQYSKASGVDDHAFNKGESNNYNSYKNSPMESGSNFSLDANYYTGMAPGVGALLPLGYMTSPEMPHQPSQTNIANNETDEKYNAFKQFDTVGDHSDHFYAVPVPGNGKVQAVKKPSKNWVKRIQHEWKILEKDLPDTIFVRVYEERMDLLRAVIVGPAGTPYHDGLFFFDVFFPPQYPNKPPLVNYRSGGLRLNPNLYACGKVCLSLLNTWAGSGCEKWNPSKSTMLQVLVSIQALVLNAKPYFNEPAYAMQANTSYGEKMSMVYNECVFLLSCKTIMYSLRNTPKHFEEFTVGHFRKYGRKILRGCKAYLDGAQVGCFVGDGMQDVDEDDKSCSVDFKFFLKSSFVALQTEFTKIGVDCSEFKSLEAPIRRVGG
ncbi:hypothetical protein EJB05_16063 [Eragrostis curvula]|uniref:E2 ubiquitin-conjugating enzyme n=1 Tax=Eragrostis curvula TaxID=38414 RepID=A0A5J9VD55_9POAL|nr:hypothetical protein EJB05_16063 [Eragrostis curvula]